MPASTSTLNMTSFGAALKVYYTNDKVESVVLDDNPLLALLPKMTKFEGSTLPIPIIIGLPNGRSASFATAQTNACGLRRSFGGPPETQNTNRRFWHSTKS